MSAEWLSRVSGKCRVVIICGSVHLEKKKKKKKGGNKLTSTRIFFNPQLPHVEQTVVIISEMSPVNHRRSLDTHHICREPKRVICVYAVVDEARLRRGGGMWVVHVCPESPG